MREFEPIRGIAFDKIEEYNTFIRDTKGLIYVNTLTFKDKLVLLYTIPKENTEENK